MLKVFNNGNIGKYWWSLDMPPWILLAKKNSTPKSNTSLHPKNHLAPPKPGQEGSPGWLPLKVINSELITLVCLNLSCNLSFCSPPFFHSTFTISPIESNYKKKGKSANFAILYHRYLVLKKSRMTSNFFEELYQV